MKKNVEEKQKSKNNKICLFHLISVFSFFSFLKGDLRYLSNNFSEITLIINTNGTKNILSSSFNKEPLDVLVNGISKIDSCKKQCELIDDYNNVTLIFEEQIESCENMFKDLNDIIEIDLSKFDFSKVSNMHGMFNGCSNLQSINFGNINTSSVENMDQLFLNCKNLKSLDLSKFDTSKVTIMSQMFTNCESIKSIDVSNFNTSKVENMFDMFGYCYQVIYINVSSFDTSHCKVFQGMFFSCYSLKYLDLSNFDLSSAENINFLFWNMFSLEYLNLCSFKTNSQIDIPQSTKYLVVNSQTTSFTNLEQLSDCDDVCFKEDTSINIEKDEYIEDCDINKFDYKKRCTKQNFPNKPILINNEKVCLEQIPENYYFDPHDKIYKECFYRCQKCKEEGNETNNNCDECQMNFLFINDSYASDKNCYENCQFYYYFDELNIYNCTYDNRCLDGYKLIKEKRKCILDCKNDEIYIYEFENLCYRKCPNGTIANNMVDKICYKIPSTIISTIPTTIITTIITKTPTTILEIIPSTIISSISKTIIPSIQPTIITSNPIVIPLNYCHILNENDKCFKNSTKEEIYEIIKNEIIKNFPNNGESVLINTEKNFAFELISLKNELDILKGNKNNTNRLSVIDLKECADILINSYNLTQDTDLLILKYENLVSNSNDKSIQYEVYDSNTAQILNLSFCSSVSIDIYIPTELKEETLELFEDLKSYGYNLFDKNDKFYNDICTPYKTKNGTDILLQDRYNDFYKANELICQNECEYSEYLSESQYLKCECNIVNQDKIELKEPEKFTAKTILNSFINAFKYSNYKVLKCTKLVFNKFSFTKNLGSLISLIYFLGYLSSLIVFCFKKIQYLNIEIQKLFENKEQDIISKNNKNNIQIFSKINLNKTQKIIELCNIRKPKKHLILRRHLYKIKNQTSRKNMVQISNINNKELGNNNGSKENLTKKETKLINHIDNTNYDDFELNSLDYLIAIESDNRKFFRIYWSLLKREHLIIFTFFSWNDYNIFSIKLSKFFLLICTDMALNVFFFSDESMHNIYKSGGKFNIFEQIIQFIFTTILSQLLQIFSNFLTMNDIQYYQIKSLSKKNIEKEKVLSIIKNIKYKLIIFDIFAFILFLFYWYVNSAFCSVYINTQNIFIIDSITSFSLGLVYPFALYLIPTGLRILSLSVKNKKNLKFIYFLSNIIPFF